jgi:hypothetical protein
VVPWRCSPSAQRMTRTILLLSLLSFPARSAFAQAPITAKTTGNCSPVIAGSTNRVTINCSGLSQAKATELVDLMNRILAEHMDLSEVNSRLDQLHGDLSALRTSVDPLANAPAQVQANLKQARLLVTRCTDFFQDWSEKGWTAETAARSNADAQLHSEREQHRATQTIDPALDESQAAEFRTQFAPRLLAINTALHRFVPDAVPIHDVTSPKTVEEGSDYARQVWALALQYQTSRTRAGQAFNSQLVDDATTINRQVGQWSIQAQADAHREALMARQAARRAAQAETLSNAHASLDQQQTKLYLESLEPKLQTLRLAMAPEVPEAAAGDPHYATVTDAASLGRVCKDFYTVAGAYQTQVTEDLKAGRSIKSR